MVSRKAFESYFKIQKSGIMNMNSKDVELMGNITKEEHIDILENYKEIYDRYKNGIVTIDNKNYPIEAMYQSEERCLMDGYEKVRDDIYIKNESIALIDGY